MAKTNKSGASKLSGPPRPSKTNLEPGPSQHNTDPTLWDPRLAEPGTPIAFPDPEQDYPTEGDPYPPPVE